jgi:hypothetical protein
LVLRLLALYLIVDALPFLIALKELYPHTGSDCSALGFEGVGATELRHRYPHKLVLHFTLCLIFILHFELLQKMQQLG